MKYIIPTLIFLILFPVLLSVPACTATGAALEDQAQAYKDLRLALDDPYVTQVELETKLDDLAAKTQAVVEAAKDDTEGLTGDPLTDSALITGIGGALLYWLREKTRKRALAEIKS